MLRIPRDLIDVDTARQYCTDDTLSIHLHKSHAIFSFTTHDEEGDFYDWEYQNTWLSSMIPLRDKLLRCDFRCLYLAWLARIWPDYDDPISKVWSPEEVRLACSTKRDLIRANWRHNPRPTKD